jgi:DNA-binding LytR/AlgR family response regulator
MNVLIIEDEILSAEDLSDTLTQISTDLQVTAILHSVKESIEYLRSAPAIDLIFSDIQLGDGLSFEIFRELDLDVPIIFCTAFDEYAIEAFKNNGIDYILKPFTATTVADALKKYHQLKKYFTPHNINYHTLIDALSGHTRQSNSSILVYQKDKIFPVRMEDIALFYIDHETTRLLCFDKKIFIVSQTLDQLEKTSGYRFFRTNRQYLVNRKAITGAEHYFSRKYVVNLSVPFPETVTVSKTRTAAFLSWLTQY